MTNKLFYPAGMDVLGTYLAQIDDQEQRTNFDDLTASAAGDPGPTWTGARQYDPVFNVGCMDIATVLALFDSEALAKSCVSGDVKLFFRQAEANAIRYGEATSNHVVYTATNNALLLWDSLKANQGREATVSVQLHTTDNGSNDPLTQASGSAITVAPVVSNMYTLGPIYLNGTLISGLQSMTWNNNVQVDKIASDGNGTIAFACVRSFRPSVTIESHDIHAQAAHTVEGNAITNLTVFLRKRKRSFINYADADTEHIKLVGTLGTYRQTRTSGEQSQGAIEAMLERPSAGAAVFAVTSGVAIAAPA